MKRSDVIWTVVGLLAIALSSYLLFQEIRHISLAELETSLLAIPHHNWVLAVLSMVGAYAALAYYDRIAILHLGKKVSWWFITFCSFTTYALAHNIGASVISGAVVRYRAYTKKGLSGTEVGMLVVFCSLTFALGVLVASGAVLLFQPDILDRLFDAPHWLGRIIGVVLIAVVALYLYGALRGHQPWKFRRWTISYPQASIVLRQLIAGPLELACAASIIYFALPEATNPGFWIVFGAFLASFTLALLSHAPGGLGVLEVTFLAALPEVPTSDVLAALIVFRVLYLLVPFAIAILIVLLFELSQWRRKHSEVS